MYEGLEREVDGVAKQFSPFDRELRTLLEYMEQHQSLTHVTAMARE